MSTALSIDRRISLCSFTFADGRRCRMPHCASHPDLCTYHARKDAQDLAAKKVGNTISYDLSGEVSTACDVAAAIRHLFAAVAQGHIKPKTANTLAYLAQTLVQSAHLSKLEYIDAFGVNAWRDQVESHLYPEEQSPEAPDTQTEE